MLTATLVSCDFSILFKNEFHSNFLNRADGGGSVVKTMYLYESNVTEIIRHRKYIVYKQYHIL